jgi:hypothetical protein
MMSERTRHGIVAAVGLGAAVILLLHQQVRHLDYVPDLGDPLFSIWRVGWVNHQLLHDPRHLFDTNVFYPERLTLTFSDPIVLPALTAAPALAVGIHPVIVYNLLLLSGFWLSGIAVYLLAVRLTGSARAAFVAGLVYACALYRFDHYSHLELQMMQWMPLGLLALHLLVTRDSDDPDGSSRQPAAGRRDSTRWWYALAFAAALVAQLYSSMYYAVFFVVYAAVVGAGLLIAHRPSPRRLVLPLLVSAAVAAAAALPLVGAFVAAEPIKGERGLNEIAAFSAVPSDYLRVNKVNALWGQVLRSPRAERALFPGVMPFALAAAGAAPPFGAIPLIYTAALAVSFDGSLGLNGVSYPVLHRWLSPFRGLRSPARFAALVALTLAILAGFGARRVLAWRASRAYREIVFAALIALVLVEAWPSLALGPVWREPPDLYRLMKYIPNAVLAEMPMLQTETANIPYMYFSIWHWLPMVNGYSGFVPKSYQDLRRDLALFPAAEAVEALRKRGVTHITVNCGFDYAGCNELMDAMRHARRLRLVAATVWRGFPVQLYEVLPP